MLKVGVDISAEQRWHERADAYLREIDSPYHRHRLEVIKTLLPGAMGKTVVDFGCGEGVLSEYALNTLGADMVVGIDINSTLIDAARTRINVITRMKNKVRFLQGDVRRLVDYPCHLLVAANVLAYLSKEEEARFYRAAAETVAHGGCLVVTHSNILFDLFTLNAYTKGFFAKEFGCDVSSLLTNTVSARTSFSIRENPLTYADKLKSYGFLLEKMEFMNYHGLPPLLSGEDPDDMQRERAYTLNWPAEERWKLMFQCSMFGVRARKI